MYVNLRVFSRALRTTFLGRPPSPRRWAFAIGGFAAFWTMWCLVALGRLLDHVFFPGFRKVEIHSPIFIVGAPRSGTSFAQSLMALDDRLAHTKLHQTILPSILYQRALQGLVRVDRAFGRIFSRLVGAGEGAFFGGWQGLHSLQLSEPEEDEGLFFYALMSEAVYLLFPYFRELPDLGFPDRLPARQRRRFMRYYESCLKRQLYLQGTDKLVLSKSTSFGGRVDAMLETFPDAKIVHLVRHPYECIPSHVSLFHRFWRIHSPEIAKNSRESKAYAQLAVDWYRAMFDKLSRLPPDSYVVVDYRELVEDPDGTIEGIYAQLGLPMTARLETDLKRAARISRKYASIHSYSLEEYGLSRSWVREQLGDVLEAYGFEQ
jgi:hypothetical protein